MHCRSAERWRCIDWGPRLLVWVFSVAVLVIEVKAGITLPTAVGIAVAAGFVARSCSTWLTPLNAGPEEPGSAACPAPVG